jgi:hypothetical protein
LDFDLIEIGSLVNLPFTARPQPYDSIRFVGFFPRNQ